MRENYIIHKYPTKEYKRLYSIYHGIKKRCYSKSEPRYKDYGGRGIAMCEEWLENFDNFVDWALLNGYEDELTIDRVDNDGNYGPENCRWVTKKVQNRNKRTNVLITYNGQTKCLRDWCDELNLPYDATHNRITKGWPVDKAFTEPLFDHETAINRIAKERGINPCTLRDRIKKLGWDYEKAINTPAGSVDVTTKEYKEEHFGYADCPICQKHFLKNSFRMKYCGPECNIKAKRIREKQRTA